MNYNCAAGSLSGFVQMLACNYLPHGYWFYVTGHVPEAKQPLFVDQKLVEKYGIDRSRSSRARRKVAGLANIHYLRHRHFFVLLATHGHHDFFEEEGRIRDVRRLPIRYGGYSISVQQGGYLRKDSPDAPAERDPQLRVRVQIDRAYFRELRGYFSTAARCLSTEQLTQEFKTIGFEPYAPVRQQLLNLLRIVNWERKLRGMGPLDPSVIRYRRKIVRPFESDNSKAA